MRLMTNIIDVEALSTHPNDWLIVLVAGAFIMGSLLLPVIANANNALRSMGAAKKMLASVYGIAITGMSFFTDPQTLLKDDRNE